VEGAPGECGAEGSAIRSHLVPRTTSGRVALLAFLALFALAQPPVVHGVVNRTEPWILGLPFLFVYLLVVYTALIGVLTWTAWRNL